MLSILILACHQEQIFSFEKTTSSSTNSAEPAAPTEEDSVEDTSAEDSASESSFMVLSAGHEDCGVESPKKENKK